MKNNKTEYTYSFANGDSVKMTAEVLGEEKNKWIELLIRFDLDEQSNDKKEKRRHCSYEAFDPEGELLASDDNVEQLIENFQMLSKFLKTLTNLERLTFIGRFMHGYSQQEMADTLETSQQMISWTENKLRKKVKKFFF